MNRLLSVMAVVLCVILIGCGTSTTSSPTDSGASTPGASSGSASQATPAAPSGAATVQGLFVPVTAKAAPKASDPNVVMRARVVTVNQSLLGAVDGELRKTGATKVSQLVTLNLFDDTRVVASLDKASDGYDGNKVWTGKIVGDDMSLVIFVQRQEAFVGSIVYLGYSYRVRSLGQGFSAVEQLDLVQEPMRGEPLRATSGPVPAPIIGTTTAAPSTGAEASKQAAAGTTVMDLLVVYTAKAAEEEGGTNGILATIDIGVTQTNNAFANSLITNVQLNLVSAQQIGYTEVLGDLRADLAFVSTSANIQTIHQNTGADLVMLVPSGNMDPALGAVISAGGLAWLKLELGKGISGVTPYGTGFSVVPVSQIRAYDAFPHELGHNMGMTHDLANSGGAGFFADSYGWRQPGHRRDIMAYSCSSNCTDCTACPFVYYYANPNVTTPGGFVTGTAEAYAARAAMTTASDIAAYTSPAPTPTPTPSPSPSPTPTPTPSPTPTPTPTPNPAPSSPRVVVGLGASGNGTSEVWYPAASSFSLTRQSSPQIAWPAYNATSNAPVYLASGDIDGDGLDEIVVGLGPGGQGWCCVLDDSDHAYALLGWFQLDWAAYNSSGNAPTFPGCFDLTGSGKMVIAIGTGGSGQGWVEFFEWSAAQGKIVPKIVGTSQWLQVNWAAYNASPNAEVHPAGALFAGNGRNGVTRQAGSLLLGLGRAGKGWVERLDSNGTSLNTGAIKWFQTGWTQYNAWGEASTWPAAGDYDGDGYDDLAVGFGYNGYGWISVMHNDGTGTLGGETWQRASLSGYSGPDNIGYTFPTWGDVDQDGKDDLVVGLGPAGQGYIDILKGNTWTHTLVKSLVASYSDSTRPACLRR